MKLSARAKRMERRRKRSKFPEINLVSMMDIFTILVFFLLVNSSDAIQPPNQKVVQLPKSTAELLPDQTVSILVNDQAILVNGHAVIDVPSVMAMPSDMIPALQKELRYQASKSVAPVDELGVAQRDITIMGDKAIPYGLLRKIMVTCSNSEYTNISLAVLKKPADKNS